MSKRSRFYVGRKNQIQTVFTARETPTEYSHPEYHAAIGPFRTKRGAEFMAKNGSNNPHIRTVMDAERAAQSELLNCIRENNDCTGEGK